MTFIFPVAKGTTWIYAAHVKSEQPNGGKILETDVRWTTTVLDFTEEGRVSAALLRGDPWDLAWYTPETQPQEFLIVRVETDYYLVSDKVREWFSIFQHGINDEPEEELADDIWFHTPLQENDFACPPDVPKNLQPMYCWFVQGKLSGTVSNVKGLKRLDQGYELALRTNPEALTVALVPGVGITRFTYHHHGTTSEVDGRLVEFRKR